MKTIRLLLFILLVPLTMAEAFLVVRLNLEQLTALADQVFVGRCASVKTGKDLNGRPVQFVTYEVREMIKGEPADKVTFKQILMPGAGWPGVGEDAGPGNGRTAMAELPTYAEGEEDVVFLSASGDTGLTAPIGLSQGKFRISENSQGERSVQNGLGNKGLFVGMGRSPRLKTLSLSTSEKKMVRGGESTVSVSVDDFVSLVKKLVP